MAGTNFTGPVSQGEKTGNPQTQTVAYHKVVRQVSLSQAASRQVITIPPNSTILNIGAIPTSSFTGDKANDMNVNFGSSADADQYGLVQVGNASFAKQTQILTKQVSVGGGTKQGFIALPPHSTLLRLGAIQTSAFSTPGDAVSAGIVNFGTEGDKDQYGALTDVSAAQGLTFVTPVSGVTDFDAGGILVVSCSVETTSVFTNGGARAFVEYAVVNDTTGLTMQPAGSAAAGFDSGGTLVLTLSAAATTTFTGGGVRAFVEYVTVE